MGAGAFVPFGRAFQAQFSRTGAAFSGIAAVNYFIQVSAFSTDQHIQRVALVLGQEIAGEEVKIFMAVGACLLFHPEKVFHMGLVGTAFQAAGAIQAADLFFQGLHQAGGGCAVRLQVQMFNLPVDDPPGHWVDVVPQHVAPHPIGFDQRGSAPHERVGNGDPLEVVGGEKRILQRPVTVFSEEQPPEQGPGPPGKPFVHGDDWPVVLLDLLFTQGQGRDERYVKVGFYGHEEVFLSWY